MSPYPLLAKYSLVVPRSLAQRSIQVGPKQSDVLSTTTRLPAAIEHLAPLLEERYLSTKIRKALKILEEIRTGSAGKDKTIVYVSVPISSTCAWCIDHFLPSRTSKARSKRSPAH